MPTNTGAPITHTPTVPHPAFYRCRESYQKEMDHREIAIRVPVMNEVHLRFFSFMSQSPALATVANGRRPKPVKVLRN